MISRLQATLSLSFSRKSVGEKAKQVRVQAWLRVWHCKQRAVMPQAMLAHHAYSHMSIWEEVENDIRKCISISSGESEYCSPETKSGLWPMGQRERILCWWPSVVVWPFDKKGAMPKIELSVGGALENYKTSGRCCVQDPVLQSRICKNPKKNSASQPT